MQISAAHPESGANAPDGAWHALPAREVLDAVASGAAALAADEAGRRLAAEGPNLLRMGRRVGALELLGRQFLDPLFYVLIGSGVLAVAMGKTVDGVVVLGVVVALAGIGMFLLVDRAASARDPGAALREAQTAAVTTAILVRCFYLLECRSLTRSLFAIRPGPNRWVYAGIGGVVLAQIAFVHLPLFNRLFASAPLTLDAWLRSALAARVVIPVVEAHRAWTRRRSRVSAPRLAAA